MLLYPTQYRPVKMRPVTVSQTCFIALLMDISTLLHYTAAPQVFCQYRICQTFPGGSMAVLQSHTPHYSHTVAVHALAKHLPRFHARISGGTAQSSPCCTNLKKSCLELVFTASCKNLPDFPEPMCTSALCLPMYQVSPSVLPLLPTPAHDRAVE